MKIDELVKLNVVINEHTINDMMDELKISFENPNELQIIDLLQSMPKDKIENMILRSIFSEEYMDSLYNDFIKKSNDYKLNLK